MKLPLPVFHRDEGCGHSHCHGEHHHEYHHGEHCSCGCDTTPLCASCKKPFAECTCALKEGVQRKVYILEHLGCANCAAKMERKINDLPQVDRAVITFATKQLCLTAVDPDGLLPEVQRICASIEGEVKVVEKSNAPRGKKGKEEKAETFFQKEGNKELVSLLIGVVLFAGALVCSLLDVMSLPLFILAYLVLGKDILVKAFQSVVKGHALDENFLMAIASIGAFLIGEYVEAVAVVMFFCIGELFEERAVAKSRNQIMDALDMRPETVLLLSKNEVIEIPAEDAMVGDVLQVRPGDRIPLDGIIIEGESRLDTSPVTGEPVPLWVGQGSEVFSGCINGSGVLKLKVTKPLSESMVTRILDAVERAAEGKPKIDRFITRFARIYTPCVVSIALLTAVIPSLITGAWQQWIYTALTFLVISCPCALVLSVPLAYFSGIGFGSRHGILFKSGAALEALKEARAVVMDKTGTLTKGNFTVAELLCADGVGEEELLFAAASAEVASTHPIAASVREFAEKRKIAFSRPEEILEIPGRGVAAALKGKEIFCGSSSLLEMQGIKLPQREGDFYGTEVYVAMERRFLGVIRIADEIKEDAKTAVKEMSAMGLTSFMLTGDREAAAKAVAKETGVTAYRGELLPEEKLSALEDIRKESGAVFFVGDGINDAPVLAGADVGAAMGSGADAAIEAADVVFMTSEMRAVPLALKVAKKVGRIAAENVIFALGIKFAVMVLGFMGFANMWFAIFADTGVAILCILNSIRILYGTVR